MLWHFRCLGQAWSLQSIAQDTGGRYFGAGGCEVAHMYQIFARERAAQVDGRLADLDFVEVARALGLYEYLTNNRVVPEYFQIAEAYQ